jgi:acyl CoA:acetate/3-ketoacid CoA transferase
VNGRRPEDVARVIELEGEEFLLYPRRPIGVAFLRGTTAAEEGNVRTRVVRRGYNPAYAGEVRVVSEATGAAALDARKAIARAPQCGGSADAAVRCRSSSASSEKPPAAPGATSRWKLGCCQRRF